MAAEAFLASFLQMLVDKLASRDVLKYFGLVKSVDKKLTEWIATWSAIGAVLIDAEKRQLADESNTLKLWLDELRDLAFDAEDVLDKYHTEMLKRRIQHAHSSAISKAWKPFPNGVFNWKMNSDIEKITERLQKISVRKDQLGLKIDTVTWTPGARQYIPPSSSLSDRPVIGREEDKRKIVELLSKQEHRAVNFDVVAIVGMAGVGKTTLAGQVFKDMEATQMFQPAVWVCVSDDFNLERVTKQILQSITSRQYTTEDYEKVQNDLHKELAGKKFLIVLDDVWKTCSYGEWMKLQSPFRDGAQGSKIVVTTRDTEVSKMMGAATLVHNLVPMQNDVCLQVFEQHALLNANRPPNYESLKEKIVAKCRGLPLAARTLGGVLLDQKIDKWEEILNDKLWSLSDKHDILPVLRLSYFYLPSHLKRCFAYCSILPNDYEFGEMQMILLWMAEGLIHHRPEDNKQIEDLGADYFRELVCRSLFQKSTEDTSKYVMHDLIGDLARWAAGDICFRLEDKQNNDGVQLTCFPKARHSSYLMGDCDGVKRFEVFSEVKCLRTFLPLRKGSPYNYLSRQVTFDLLPKLQYLRVLSFNGYRITELPNSIGDLRYLRYLDVSYTLITCLPKSLSTLYNLQTLILEGCSELKSLPADMSNLINLRHLNNSDVSRWEGMPPKLGRLENLQLLPNFVVSGESDQSGIREIGPLSQLRGTLCLSRLENVTDVEDARRANLKCKERLDSLVLEWSHSSDTGETESAVLDMFQPHTKIKELTIKSYAGKEFSSWVGGSFFSNMVLVRLEECNNCLSLPPLGQLPQLKELYIRGMNAVESVGAEFYGECVLAFPLLEILEFVDMQHWKVWLPFQLDHRSGVFPCLKRLSIEKCSQLEGKLPENLDLLAELEIVKCEELAVSIANYKQLRQLNIKGCKVLVHTDAKVEFELLESLCLSNISEVMSLQTGELLRKGLSKVRDLKINGCEKLTSSWKNEGRLLQRLTCLGRLKIEDNSRLVEELGEEAEELLQLEILECKLECLKLKKCENLLKLPKGLNQLSSLQELRIYECSSLVSFPDVGLPPSLKDIEITGCHSLIYFAKFQIPQNLRRIEIRDCKSLKSLVDEEECERLGLIAPNGIFSDNTNHCLECIHIWDCQNLKSLPDGLCHLSNLQELHIAICGSLVSIPRLSGGRRPSNLRKISIMHNLKLEALPEDMHNLNSLECIEIWDCQNLKSLPDGLCYLSNLQTLIIINCGSLVSISRLSGGRRPSNLRKMGIYICEKLEALPEDMHNLNSLEELSIDYREGLTFPPNLTSLEINMVKSCKSLWELEWGLHRLTSLTICGYEDPDTVSFPPDMVRMETLFPKSLTSLSIEGFPNLKKLSSKGFQFLTSLQHLGLWNCPKLASIPEEGLPPSLERLFIFRCPVLKERCQPGKGRYWHKISHIPSIQIDGREI
ncbi:putative disease resistance protein At3g14460 [Pyrus x bretschneideri]|uniref:putative disease resistance protein At3g14460 n=1 Tax=Pyrus x bretschneideri TaxID=225117 RepID=UPI00202E64D1|nr:putative disease resistance protein At3g14460 [Pyrus x bretschneideri]XP_048426013.1 putative disease resistance protein At3g14460 [Pyrus x bretschneideri]XP_048426014.1 putative disease resistance protein At3g14460 [Pyrus x bretschneideri]XP_048426016.1 putative disease resistance protein At3g14460 [Pyrus x bretschneideri]XP_048426017.1 putative disease resistance protein At3g14460 [Pyrus x bretschneideri]XP_048426018.1 putative disease resistance protein At3g14460 [Pyrus x bretschneideri]